MMPPFPRKRALPLLLVLLGSGFCLPAGAEPAAPPPIATLLGQLDSPDLEVSGAAAFALRQLGEPPPEVFAALTRQLDSPSEAKRSTALTALMYLGEPGRAILRERARNGRPEARMAAITALRAELAGLKDPELAKAMAETLRSLEEAYNPSPRQPRPGSPLRAGTFEGEAALGEWTFEPMEGGEGRVRFDAEAGRLGKGSLRLEKTNDRGAVSLRSREPMRVKKGQAPTARLYFRGDELPTNGSLQIFFEDEKGRLLPGAASRGHAAMSQTFLRNLPPGQWSKRFVAFDKASRDGEYCLRLVLRGNPATLWIDDIAAPAPPFTYSGTTPSETLPEAARPDEPPRPVAAEVRAMPGADPARARWLLEGKPVPPILYTVLRGSFGDYAGMEALGGIRLQVSAVPLGDKADTRYPPATPVWKEAGAFDFATPLAWLDKAARNAPQSRFILNFGVSWPRDWVARHPEEAWANEAGQRAYGTGIHFNGFAEELPKTGDPRMGRTDDYRWWPSPFSQKAIEEAGEGIRRFVRAVKTRPYANRIVGCLVSGGHDGQFTTYPWPDYSAPAQRAFREWLAQRYGTDAALQAAWRAPAATLATAELPKLAGLLALARQSGSLFLDPALGQRYADHHQFQSEQGFRIREAFAAIFKEEMARPVIGMTWQLGGGRGQGAETLLPASRGLDVIVPQPYYELRQPGYIGGVRASLGSLARHGKLVVKELDLRTWLRAGGEETPSHRLGAAMSPALFRAIFRKEAAQMIAAGHGFWLFDIGTTHFRDPEMLGTIAEGVRAYEELELQNPTPFRPNVALVWSDESDYWNAGFFSEAGKQLGGGNSLKQLDRYTPAFLRQSGVPFEEVYLSDLLADPAAYAGTKVFVFVNAVRLTAAQRAGIREHFQNGGRTLVWDYATGYLGDGGLSENAAADLPGIALRAEAVSRFAPVRFAGGTDALAQGLSGVVGFAENTLIMGSGSLRPLPKGFHRFVFTDPEAVPLARYEGGGVAIAARRFPGWTSVAFGAPGLLDPVLLHRIAEAASATTLARPPAAVEFNGRFLSIHGLTNRPVEVTLPRESRVTDFDTGEEVARGRKLRLPVPAGETRWYKVEPVSQ